MEQRVTPHEAQAALDTVERGRRRVVEEVGLPVWYWWGLAVGWIVLGVLADLDQPVITSVATFVFGAANSAAMSRVASGRHRTSSISVRASVAGRHVRGFVIGALVLLGFLTVGLALAAQADGADHPVTAASIVVAVIILLGGPRLFDVLKRKAADEPVAE
jgi:hypothetical protein